MSIPFKYSTDGGATWESASEQGATVALSNGVIIAFGSSELASNTATAAPGDLPPLPMPLDDVEVWLPDDLRGDKKETRECEASDNYWSADQMREYGRACIASNAGAAHDAAALAWQTALDSAAFYVAGHCANGEHHAETIIEMPMPKMTINGIAPSTSPAGAKEQTK